MPPVLAEVEWETKEMKENAREAIEGEWPFPPLSKVTAKHPISRC